MTPPEASLPEERRHDPSLLKNISSKLTSLRVIGAFLLAAGGAGFALASRVVTKADLSDVKQELTAALATHAASPHPLTPEEREQVKHVLEEHEKELVERGELRAQGNATAKQVDWITAALLNSPRIAPAVSSPPPPMILKIHSPVQSTQGDRP